jgi:hypothetical protein
MSSREVARASGGVEYASENSENASDSEVPEWLPEYPNACLGETSESSDDAQPSVDTPPVIRHSGFSLSLATPLPSPETNTTTTSPTTTRTTTSTTKSTTTNRTTHKIHLNFTADLEPYSLQEENPDIPNPDIPYSPSHSGLFSGSWRRGGSADCPPDDVDELTLEILGEEGIVGKEEDEVLVETEVGDGGEEVKEAKEVRITSNKDTTVDGSLKKIKKVMRDSASANESDRVSCCGIADEESTASKSESPPKRKSENASSGKSDSSSKKTVAEKITPERSSEVDSKKKATKKEEPGSAYNEDYEDPWASIFTGRGSVVSRSSEVTKASSAVNSSFATSSFAFGREHAPGRLQLYILKVKVNYRRTIDLQ